MKFPKPQSSGIGTTGAVGVSLMVLHLTGFVTGWYWPIIYILFILSAIGQENRKG
tara:strand:+ start:1682 stop:1846 length:165 start_codon:yes stop_codon:yes gene_type:complete